LWFQLVAMKYLVGMLEPVVSEESESSLCHGHDVNVGNAMMVYIKLDIRRDNLYP